MTGTVPDHMSILDAAGSSCLTFKCGDLPADAAVLAAGHEPNGTICAERPAAKATAVMHPEPAGRAGAEVSGFS